MTYIYLKVAMVLFFHVIWTYVLFIVCTYLKHFIFHMPILLHYIHIHASTL